MVKQTESFLEKKGTSKKNKNYLEIKNFLNKNNNSLGYLKFFVFLHFEKKIKISDIKKLFFKLQKNKNLLKKLPFSPVEYESFKELDDDLKELEIEKRYNDFLKICPSNTKKIIKNKRDIFYQILKSLKESDYQKKKEKIKPIISSFNNYKEIINFLKKKNYNTKNRILILFFALFTFTPIIYRRKNVIILKIKNYKQQLIFGSYNWCITRHYMHFKKYINKEGKQYILFNLNLSKNDPDYKIGFNLDSLKKINYAKNNNNNSVYCSYEIENYFNSLGINIEEIFFYKPDRKKIKLTKKLVLKDNKDNYKINFNLLPSLFKNHTIKSFLIHDYNYILNAYYILYYICFYFDKKNKIDIFQNYFFEYYTSFERCKVLELVIEKFLKEENENALLFLLKININYFNKIKIYEFLLKYAGLLNKKEFIKKIILFLNKDDDIYINDIKKYFIKYYIKHINKDDNDFLKNNISQLNLSREDCIYIVSYIIDISSLDFYYFDCFYKYNPAIFHYNNYSYYIYIIKSLINNGISKNNFEETLNKLNIKVNEEFLKIAIRNCNYDVVKFLLSKIKNINIDKYINEALFSLFFYKDGRIFDTLLEYKRYNNHKEFDFESFEFNILYRNSNKNIDKIINLIEEYPSSFYKYEINKNKSELKYIVAHIVKYYNDKNSINKVHNFLMKVIYNFNYKLPKSYFFYIALKNKKLKFLNYILKDNNFFENDEYMPEYFPHCYIHFLDKESIIILHQNKQLKINDNFMYMYKLEDVIFFKKLNLSYLDYKYLIENNYFNRENIKSIFYYAIGNNNKLTAYLYKKYSHQDFFIETENFKQDYYFNIIKIYLERYLKFKRIDLVKVKNKRIMYDIYFNKLSNANKKYIIGLPIFFLIQLLVK